MSEIYDKLYKLVNSLADQYGFDTDKAMELVEDRINTLLEEPTNDITNINTIPCENIKTFLKKLKAYPDLLKVNYPEMIKILHALTDKKGQGTGNMPTNQEACFAIEAQNHGFKLLKKAEHPSENGCFIKYQPNGTQQSIDFILMEVSPEGTKSVMIDLKHTNGKSFYWNDGWFEDDVIYVISYTIKKQNKIYIGFGHETPTTADREAMAQLIGIKRKLNSENENTGFLRKYVRFANQYSCDQFTEEFSAERWASVEKFLA
jgi:hypothetical protein